MITSSVIGGIRSHPVLFSIICLFVILLFENFRDFIRSNHHEYDLKLRHPSSIRSKHPSSSHTILNLQRTSSEMNQSQITNNATLIVQPANSNGVNGHIRTIPMPSSTLSLANTLSIDDVDVKDWYQRLKTKYSCISNGFGALYLYHVRKAAGTSIKEVLEHASARFGVPTYSTEGITLDMAFLEMPGVLTGII